MGGVIHKTLITWSVFIYLQCDNYRIPSAVNDWISGINDLRFGVIWDISGLGTVIAGILMIKASGPGFNYFSYVIVDANISSDLPMTIRRRSLL